MEKKRGRRGGDPRGAFVLYLGEACTSCRLRLPVAAWRRPGSNRSSRELQSACERPFLPPAPQSRSSTRIRSHTRNVRAHTDSTEPLVIGELSYSEGTHSTKYQLLGSACSHSDCEEASLRTGQLLAARPLQHQGANLSRTATSQPVQQQCVNVHITAVLSWPAS